MHVCLGDAGTWSVWSAWSSCSRTCDGGFQTRQRQCSLSAIGACGSGFGKEQQLCNQSACTDGANRAVRLITSSVSSSSEQRRPEWSAWSSWSACSCYNNKQMRRRACLVYQPAILGFCLGPLVDYRPCAGTSKHDCSKLAGTCFCMNCAASVAGGWTDWTEWSSCSKDCGRDGYRVRNRMCAQPVPSNQGVYCYGQSFDKQSCQPTQAVCDGKCLLHTQIHIYNCSRTTCGRPVDGLDRVWHVFGNVR
jgi:hypothetical protein